MRRSRIGGVAGFAFVLVGLVELLVTGGPAPHWGAVLDSLAFFSRTAATGPWIAVLSAIAGVLFLVFAAALCQRVEDVFLGRLAWAGALLVLALAWAGQAAQQTAWLTADRLDDAALGSVAVLVGFLFSFALMGGAVLAGATGVAAATSDALPGWVAPFGALAAVVGLLGVALAPVAAAAFPVFLLWLLATSVAMVRSQDVPASQDSGISSAAEHS